MNKGPSTSASKTPSSLPHKSAWAKGPPQTTSSTSSPRSQSPAPATSQASSQSHSRRPSQLGSFKDAVGVGIAGGSRGNVHVKTTNPINFGTVNGSPSDKPVPTSSPPAPSPPVGKSESRPVQSFGSIEATKTNMPTTAKLSSASTSSNAPVASSSSTTSSTSTTPATAPHKMKVDVSSFFRGGSDTKISSPVNSSFPEGVTSPPMRTNSLSPAVPPPQNQNAPGPAGPGPHPQAHSHQPPPQSYPPPFVPAAMRNPSSGSGPRSPSFQRAVPNGAGGRPSVNTGPPGPNGSNMPSPRMAPPQPHVQHQHQHQQQPAPVQGMMPMQPVPGWPGYYYPYVPGAPMQGVPPEHYMHYPPQHWHMQPPQHPHQPPPGATGPPQTPLTHPHGLPMSSPRPSQPPLQAPGTPPAGMATPLPSAGPRLNSNASAFVPSHAQQQRQSRIKITDASGHEVDLTGLRKQGTTPSSTGSTPAPASDKSGSRTSVRLETEEARRKRIAEEERRQKEKEKEREEQERKKREEKEAEERKRREEEKAKAEEDARRKAEEERKRKEEEEERQRKEEEEERKRKEEVEKERLRKEEEEIERIRKEEEERLRKEEEERRRKEEEEERRRKEEEEERRRKEEEEERRRKEIENERQQREEEEAKAKIEAETAAEAEAEKTKTTPLEVKSKKESQASSTVTDAPLSTSPEAAKRRPIPGPLDLSAAHKPVSQPLPSALATARHIQDVYQVPYPEGIKSPKPELNTNAKDGKFRYDREFLLQFMSVCKEKPDNLPPLEAIGLEPVDQSHTMGRGGSGRRGIPGSMGPPSATAQRQSSIGLGFNLNGKVGSGFAMGNFAAPKLTSEERFMRSSSMSGGPGSLAFGGGRPSPMVRSSSQGGPGASGSKRTRSKRGDATRNESNRINPLAAQSTMGAPMSFEPVAPLEHTANRWVAGSTMRRGQQMEHDSPELVEKKVRALLNKLTMEKFESISNQIIAWANKSENEKDGRTLIQVIRLVFEKATDEAAWSEMYARLCRKMMEQISPNVMDEGIRNAEGKPITGGLLFRKYLLNRCQEDFERGWSDKETTAAAALVKANEDKAIKDANEKNKDEDGEVILYSDEYYAAQKAKRQGLGLIKFIGELFKLQMLTERIMHECIKKLLSNVDNPEEEEIESLCKLLTTVGKALDTSKARGHMDVYFSRMKELVKSGNVASRMQFMLQDVIELRERKWVPRNAGQAPTTLAQVHETAAREKAQQEQHNLARSAMSRGGSRRGHDRDGNAQVGPDGWAVASGPSRPSNKAGDLTNFGKIQKGGGGATIFGPASVFTKKGDSKRDSAPLSRVSSNTNMFQMLESASNEPAATTSTRASRSASRTTSVDLTHNPPTEPATPAQRPRLNLLPRSKPLHDKSESSPAGSRAEEEAEEGEIIERDSGRSSMSKEQAEKKTDQDRKEFFAIRDLDEGEEYFSALPSEYRHILVQKLVSHALEAKEADAKLVASLFERAISRNLCSPASFEEGFLPAAEALDDIAIDAPKAFSLMAIMMKGAKLDEERRTRIASKSMDSEKLLALLA